MSHNLKANALVFCATVFYKSYMHIFSIPEKH